MKVCPCLFMRGMELNSLACGQLLAGRRQVVYDARTGKRVVLDIRDVSATDDDINSALKEGINARNVLGGVLAALKARNIDVDFAS